MTKAILLLMITVIQLAAIQPEQLYGEWKTERKTLVHESTNSVYEDITLNPGSFMATMFITIQKNDYLIKDLQLQGKGTWKVSGDILVYVISEVYTVGVRETRGISQESINQLARDLHKKYMDDPIRILKIQSVSTERLITINESGATTQYRRK